MLESKVNIFKQKLTSIASSYKQKIEKAEENLKKLEEKRLSEGLNSREEDQYVEVSTFLDQTIDLESKLPRTFYSEETNRKLDGLINLAEQVLNKIPDEE